MINKKFLESIKEYKMFQPGELVLVAVSGGADSTALLNLLFFHREELGISLHVAHLNHMLRKGEADMDVKYVEGLAQRMGLPISVEAVEVDALAKEEKLGIEEAARRARYDFFSRVADKVGAAKVAVGHTADDNIETFLMRLLRGAGMKGLCGIPPKREKIVRPLIKVWRREIEDYVGGLKLVPRRDHTNYESKYLRNSVRLKLVPQLKLYNLNIKEVILQTILLLTSDQLYMEGKTAEAFKGVVAFQDKGEVKIDILKLQGIDTSLQGHVLRLAIEKVKGDLNQFTFTHIRDILEMLASTEKWELHLPGGIRAYGEKGKLIISQANLGKKEALPYRYTLSVPGEIEIKETGGILRGEFVEKLEGKEDPRVAFMDYAALGRELVIRNKLPGDRFSPLGTKGTKKLQDFFVDEKIPVDDRDLVPVVESGGKIVWVAGMRIDDNVKVTEKTKKIVRLQLL